jgi:hypothetical protein
MENPSMENIVKNVIDLQNDESDDQEIKEIKELMSQVLKEDLKVDSPFEILTFGMKMMFEEEEQRNKEVQELAEKVQHRIQQYFASKMKPIMQ